MILTLRRHFYQEGFNFRVCVCDKKKAITSYPVIENFI
jgi:hypothetical protein